MLVARTLAVSTAKAVTHPEQPSRRVVAPQRRDADESRNASLREKGTDVPRAVGEPAQGVVGNEEEEIRQGEKERFVVRCKARDEVVGGHAE